MNLANHLTVLRIVMVPLFVAALFYVSPERPWLHATAVAIFVAACVTDALDGYLARRMNQMTTLGRTIDPIADKALLVTGFLSLSLMHHLPASMKIPVWATLAVISRDVIILIGSIVIFLLTGRLDAKPLMVGKITTFLQMSALVGCLLGVAEPFKTALLALAAIFTVLSGIFYIRAGERLLHL